MSMAIANLKDLHKNSNHFSTHLSVVVLLEPILIKIALMGFA